MLLLYRQIDPFLTKGLGDLRRSGSHATSKRSKVGLDHLGSHETARRRSLIPTSLAAEHVAVRIAVGVSSKKGIPGIHAAHGIGIRVVEGIPLNDGKGVGRSFKSERREIHRKFGIYTIEASAAGFLLGLGKLQGLSGGGRVEKDGGWSHCCSFDLVFAFGFGGFKIFDRFDRSITIVARCCLLSLLASEEHTDFTDASLVLVGEGRVRRVA